MRPKPPRHPASSAPSPVGAATIDAPLVRLGIRVRADRADVALADLLPLLQMGAEEREVDGDVEYSLYGPAGELPRLHDIRALAGDALVGVRSEPVADGWQRLWHAYLRPVQVGGLVVRAPWVPGGTDDLVIDPGLCFGAGTHATTRLCLALLLDAPAGGALCDWGAGSGVLAVAAARLGWDPVTAVDVDPGAIALIRCNAADNGVVVTARRLDLAAASAPWAPTAIANLTRELQLAAALVIERVPELLLASGMLVSEADEVVAAYRPLGMLEQRRIEEGDWAAVALALDPAAADRRDGAS